MNKIVDGLEDALSFASGETPAAGITTFKGGPYAKDEQRPLIQHKTSGYWIIWNWENGCWDKCAEKVRVVDLAPVAGQAT